MNCCNTIKLPIGPKGPDGPPGYVGKDGAKGATGATGDTGGVEYYQVKKLAKEFVVSAPTTQSPLTVTLSELQAAGMLQAPWLGNNWNMSGTVIEDFGYKIWAEGGSDQYVDAITAGYASNIAYNPSQDRIEFDVTLGSPDRPVTYRIIIIG